MQRLRDLYHALNERQQRRNVKFALSAIVFITCAVVFGMLLGSSYSIDGQRRAIINTLAGQNAADGDPEAALLAQTGSFTLNGREYGGPEYVQNLDRVFDQDGNFRSLPLLTERLLDPYRPAWAPGWMLEQPVRPGSSRSSRWRGAWPSSGSTSRCSWC